MPLNTMIPSFEILHEEVYERLSVVVEEQDKKAAIKYYRDLGWEHVQSCWGTLGDKNVHYLYFIKQS